MNREEILAILYEMALTIGGEVNLHPLLTRTLQKLLYHTSFPCGMVFLDTPEKLSGKGGQEPVELRLELSVGDYELAGYSGKMISLPASLLQGEATLLQDVELLKSIPGHKTYSVALRLPINHAGVILLLSPGMPKTELPLTQVFQPIMDILAKAILLCRRNETYTEELVAERNLARTGLERFRAALDTSADSVFIIDPKTMRLVDFNQTAEKETGYSRRELLEIEFPIILPEEGNSLKLLFEDLLQSKAAHLGIDTLQRRKDGSSFAANIRFSLLHQEEGGPFVIALARDISERKALEAKILRLNSLYSVLSKVNEAIINVREPEKLYQKACQVIVEEGTFPMVWMGLLDPETRSVKPISQCGRVEGYLDTIKFTAEDVPEGRGPTGVAIRQGKYDICNDVEHDPRMEPWRNEAVKRGFLSSAAFPLIVRGKIIGALNLYAAEPFFFDQEKIQLLERLTSDIAFAVEYMEEENQRHQTETALARLSHQSELILNSIGEGIYGLDLQGNTTFVNPAASRMLGYTFDELIGKSGHRMIHHTRADGSPYPQESCPVLKAYQEGIVYRGENEVYWRKDGTSFPVEYVSTPIRENEKITGAVVAFEDITERRRAEKVLRETNEMLRKFQLGIERSGDAIFMTDLDGSIVYVNPAFEKMYGYGREEVVGKTPRLLKSGQLTPQFYKDFWELILSKQAFAGEIINKAKDERLMPIESSVNPVLDEKGDIIAFLAIQRDISERKRLEEQIRQMQKMEAVGHLAGGVAHDFNNYLTVIQGYTELLSRKVEKDSPMTGYLEEIKNASIRAAGVTRQLLLFSRRQVPLFKPTNLNHVVTDMLKMLGRLIGEQFALTPELVPDLADIQGDTSHLEQVIMNLVVNARDAMPKGGAIIIKTENVTIDEEYRRTHADARPGAFVRLSVKDTGIGMDEATLARIFEPFFTTKGKGAGTGLGLSVVYGIVKQHSGWISVETAPGKGATFKIYLPALPAAAKEVKESLESAELTHGKGERILLIEDEEGVRKSAELILREVGYQVFSAKDAGETHELFEKEGGNFDLIFSDIVLPDANGAELVEQLLEQKKIAVLLTSGYTSDEKVTEKVLKEKKHPFLQKPYSFDTLLKLIRKILEKPSP